ncbi:hypothetical protein [Mesorhizobium sp. WSM3866]|uniref:hypothetical protein n=1 Tax=Mesorhizobium sp. WSM3866 TaxID=422271 RepID=UPI001FE1B2A0|nr:hypothetical protein [Mesorhizobium sp. WSM3866]
MPILPLRPSLKSYRGGKANVQLKTAKANALAQRIADHINMLIANDPHEMQQYLFASIARDLGCSTDAVRSAISDGGYNGISIRVLGDDRRALARYVAVP